jgi:hypothetical protein
MKPDYPDWLTEDAVDLLVDLVAQRAYERIDPMDPRHGPFFDWLAREARRRLTTAERRQLDAQADAFAERIRRRVVAERAAAGHKVRCVEEAPATYPARDASAGESGDVRAATAPNEGTAPWWDLAVAAGLGRELWDEPPDAFVHLPDDITDGHYVALSVAGDSMAPLLRTGDTVLVKVGPALQSGTVIVARHPEHGYVVKQVGRVSSMRIELLSLNAAYAPLVIPNDATLVLGTVLLRWRPQERQSRA